MIIHHIKQLIDRICRKTSLTNNLLAAYLMCRRFGYLSQSGWLRSFHERRPVDSAGRPLPWYTYSAIAFIEKRIKNELSVFEYGSGYSTLWWSGRVSRVVSCEHDQHWYQQMQPQLPPSVEYINVNLVPGGDYSKVILKYSCEFDVIVIDGRDRVACARNCLNALKPDGIVIWDDSDRNEYISGYEFLREKGFSRLDFSGLGPSIPLAWCTSLFYRADNCFGI